MNQTPLIGLDDSMKLFIVIVLTLGTLSISILFLILKRIERKNPDKIRWR